MKNAVRHIGAGLIAGVWLAGCVPATTLTLMPDESGKVGAITVQSPGEFRVLDQAYQQMTVRKWPVYFGTTGALSEAQVYQDYADVLKAQPAHSLSFMVYFSAGSADLENRTRAIIPQIIDGIQSHMPTEITIIGHTDTTGSDAINRKLSLDRALAVEKVLREGIPSRNTVKIQSFGSKGLLVPTPPNIDEPRNRAVEILIL